MTVFSGGMVVDQWNVTSTDGQAGPFSAHTLNGQLPVPHHNEFGVLDESTYGAGGGGAIAGQGGSVSIF